MVLEYAIDTTCLSISIYTYIYIYIHTYEYVYNRIHIFFYELDRRKDLCNSTWVFQHNVPASDQYTTSNLKWTRRLLASSPSLAETSLGVGDLNSQQLVRCAMPNPSASSWSTYPPTTHPEQERKNSAAITQTRSVWAFYLDPMWWYYRHLSTIYISWYIMLLSGTSSWTWSVIWRRDGARGDLTLRFGQPHTKVAKRELSVSLRPLTCKACPDKVKKPGATPPSACKPLPLKIYWLSWC